MRFVPHHIDGFCTTCPRRRAPEGGRRNQAELGYEQSNRRKHGIDFADAVEVFYDELACTMSDPDHHGEQRFVLTGTDAFRRVLVVVYAQPDSQTIRIISARAATAAERRHYEHG
jgi:hypothetical protein